MAIRKILLPLQLAATAAAAFSAAAMVARLWRAHLAVLHAAVNRDQERAVRDLFERLTAEQGLAVAEARPDVNEATASFAAVIGREPDVIVAQQARLADLIAVPHPAGDKEVSSLGTLHATPVNFYSDLPALAFQRTSVTMEEVVRAFNASDQAADVKRASYVMFRIESGNGAKGINNNYCGAQADSGRWRPESLTSSFAGTVTIKENGTQRLRIFLAFKTMQGNLDFLMNRVLSRGLFIGGHTHLVLTMNVNSEDDLARAYHKEWVTGSAASEPSAHETADFLSMYGQAMELIT